ncbi:MAG: pentapeptide repeat-containing protein [Maricaulaceae bacterium]
MTGACETSDLQAYWATGPGADSDPFIRDGVLTRPLEGLCPDGQVRAFHAIHAPEVWADGTCSGKGAEREPGFGKALMADIARTIQARLAATDPEAGVKPGVSNPYRIASDDRAQLRGAVVSRAIKWPKRDAMPLFVNFDRAWLRNFRANETLWRDAGFEDAHFEGSADFRGAHFEGFADFENAHFEGTAHFEDAHFEGDANFYSAHFKQLAEFRGAHFEDVARFQNAHFEGDADFEDAHFGSVADFSAPAPNLRTADKSGAVTIQPEGAAEMAAPERADWRVALTTGSDGLIPLTGGWTAKGGPTKRSKAAFRRIDFTGATFAGDRVDFSRREFLETATFDRAIFHTTPVFHDAKLNQDTSFVDAVFEPFPPDWPTFWPVPTAQRAETQAARERAFRTLKLAMGKQDAKREEAQFYKLELEARRKRPTGRAVTVMEKVFSWAYKLSCDYGERIVLPLFWLLVLGLGFTATYHQAGQTLAAPTAIVACADAKAVAPPLWSEAVAFSFERTVVPVARQNDGRYPWACALDATRPELMAWLGLGHRTASVGLLFVLALTLRRRFQLS